VSSAPAAPRPSVAAPGAASNTTDATLRATATSFRIAVFGDVNSGTSATPPAVFTSVCRAVRSRGASVAWFTGDAVVDLGDADDATARARWEGYLAVESAELSAFMPVWRTAGDNDRLDRSIGLSLWNEFFPGLPTVPDAQRRWYSRTSRGVHTIYLNSAYGEHMGWIGYVSETSADNSDEARWLVQDLRAATAGRGRRTIVVVTHYSPLNGKTTKPYAGAQQAEAVALRSLFAKYGVDLVIAGDTHVYRRTMLRVVRKGVAYRIPFVQIPPAASSPRAFGSDPIPGLEPREAGWAPDSGSRGFVQLRYDADTRRFRLTAFRVAVADGAVSSAEPLKANATPLGGTFTDVPEGCRLP
jgi:hypothetical protein